MELIQINIRAESSPETRQILEGFNHLFRELHELRKVVETMSATAVTKDQFDAALAALLAAEATRDAAVIQAIKDLQDKVASGQEINLVDELSKVLTLTTNAATITQTATAADPGPTTVPTTPITPDPGTGDGTTT